jgi:hypothetical protein
MFGLAIWKVTVSSIKNNDDKKKMKGLWFKLYNPQKTPIVGESFCSNAYSMSNLVTFNKSRSVVQTHLHVVPYYTTSASSWGTWDAYVSLLREQTA